MAFRTRHDGDDAALHRGKHYGDTALPRKLLAHFKVAKSSAHSECASIYHLQHWRFVLLRK